MSSPVSFPLSHMCVLGYKKNETPCTLGWETRGHYQIYLALQGS